MPAHAAILFAYNSLISKMTTAAVSVNSVALFLALSLLQTGLSLALSYMLQLGRDISRARSSCFQNVWAPRELQNKRSPPDVLLNNLAEK